MNATMRYLASTCRVDECLNSAPRSELCLEHVALTEYDVLPGRLSAVPAARYAVRRYGALYAASPAVGKAVSRARRDGGLTMIQADRLAARLGVHPSELWDEWWDLP